MNENSVWSFKIDMETGVCVKALKGLDSVEESGAEMNDFGIFKLIHGGLIFIVAYLARQIYTPITLSPFRFI